MDSGEQVAHRAGENTTDAATHRGHTHVVQIRPAASQLGWIWVCLTCGERTRSSTCLSATARAAASQHSDDVTLLP